MSPPASNSRRRAWATGGGQHPTGATGHADTICAVTVAESGGQPIAVTVDRGRTMRTWEVDSGQPVDPPRRLTHHRNAETATPGRRRTLLDTGGDVKAVAAARDGRILLVTGDDDHLAVWDPATGEPTPGPPLRSLSSPCPLVTALAAAEVDGRSILLAAGRYGVDAWDPATGTPMSHLPTDDLNPVYALATAAIDGRSHLVTAHRDSTVRVRDLATGMPTGRPLTGHDGWVTAVATARVDGRPVAVTGSYGSHGTLRLWELTDPRPGGEVIAGHDGWVGAVVATTVSERPILAVAYVNRPAVHVYDLMSRRSSRVATGLDHPVTALAATAHGHLVVGVGRDVAVLIPD